ncbi:MAG: hypothetical protein ABFC94_04870 [Syntrophomonas sp.]
MMLPPIDHHVEEIKHFLREIRTEIETITKPISVNSTDLPAIDKYLYEINSFYYQSFDTHFMPVYERRIEQEMAALLHISQQEDMVKKDLLANLKRYAQLYNQVKTLTVILSTYRSDINSHLLAVINEKEQLSTELLYSVKQLQGGIEQLYNILKPLLEILADREYLSSMAYSQVNIHAVQMLTALDCHNIQMVKNWNGFLLNLELLKNLLKKLDHPDDQAAGRTIIKQISANVNNYGNKLLPPLQEFFEKNVQPMLIKQMELISLYLDKGSIAKVSELALELAEWLSELLPVLNQNPAYLSKLNPNLLINLLSMSTPLDINLITKLEKHTAEMLSAINIMLKELIPASEPDFIYFSNQAQQIIDKFYSDYYKLTNNQNIKNSGMLYSALIRVTTDSLLLEGRIELLLNKHEHKDIISSKSLTLVNMLDSYLNLLANTRADLERLLAPRNLNRIWKDINIRIDRLPLEKGQVFPDDYRYILDECAVETRITDDLDMTVLHEEGDIFIIRVDELVEEEVPYMIISMKG